MSDYELLIIGAGPGGYVAAIRAAQLGLKTAIAEKELVGGACLNRGCVPTKSLLYSAGLYELIKRAGDFGISAGEAGFDFAAIHAHKNEVVEKLRGGVELLLKQNKVALLRGVCTVTGAGEVELAEADGVRRVTADKILIAAGAAPAIPPIPGAELEGVVSSDELLQGSPEFCHSLTIVGGGVIGVELGSVYAALGCKVTIIEALPRILPNMDRELSQSLALLLKKRGIEVYTGCKVLNITKNGDLLRCAYEGKGGEAAVESEKLLIATGRRPVGDRLFREGFAPAIERGRILVNERFETTIPNIYAIGDVSSKLQLAHAASAQGAAAAEYIAGLRPTAELSLIPACVYTEPEIASVGLTADDAKAAGVEVKTAKYLMSGNSKTVIENGERGFIKLVAAAETGVLLGAQLMCERASDMIGELTAAIAGGLTAEELLRGVRPHPSFNEGVGEALEALLGRSIHSAPRPGR